MGVLNLLTLPSTTAAASQPLPEAMHAVSLSEAAKQVPFRVGEVTTLPFKPTHSSAIVMKVGQHPAIEINFTDGLNWASLTQTDITVVPTSDKYVLTEVQLPNGLTAKFMDNGVAKILSWSSDGMSYQLAIGGEGNKFTQADLVDVAESIK
jgi:hypothetical protein